MSTRARLLSGGLVMLVGIAALGQACNPNGALPNGLTQVEEGFGSLQFVTCASDAPTTFRSIALDKEVPQPFQSWMWRATQLEADPQTTTCDGTSPFCVVPAYGPGLDISDTDLRAGSAYLGRYRPTGPNLCMRYEGISDPQRRTELLLYAHRR